MTQIPESLPPAEWNAFNVALRAAASRLDWSRPCLVWLADFVLAETGTDISGKWKDCVWDRPTALRALAELAETGVGATEVERAMDTLAKRHGWQRRESAQQGAVMVGVFTDPSTGFGFPAIFDGWRGWLVAYFGNATIVRDTPVTFWEIVA